MKPFAQTSECLTIERYRIPAICESWIIVGIFIGAAETRAHLSHVKSPIDSEKNWQVASDVGLAHMTIEQPL